MDRETAQLAAKFSPRGAGGAANTHPLICHMLDVASLAEAVWKDGLAAQLKARLAAALGLDDSAAANWVAFLAGAHDVGKASPVFQAKGSAGGRSTPEWLTDTRFAFSQLEGVADVRHGVVTTAHLPGFMVRRFGMSEQDALRMAVVTGGHHGTFATAAARQRATGIGIGEPRRGAPNPWPAARDDLLSTLVDVTNAEGSPTTLPNAEAMILAGLISVVDWIGSIAESRFFPFAPDGPADLSRYFEDRRGRARQALEALVWKAWPQPKNPASFAATFPNITTPRDLQLGAQAVSAELAGPGLVIVEAPMGEGKTEAALYLAEHWNASGFRGTYIAMPTQATSNQLFTRFKIFLASRYDNAETVNLQLLHGHAALSAEVSLLRAHGTPPYPTDVDLDGASAGAAVGAAEWFTHRKRGLLAPFGVGTIDQALMAVLQVNHGFVRLFGLAGKTVVFDEVHAYDTYMTALLERLLEWLAAVGSPVVLLSATLPATTRRRLTNAYLRGVGRPEVEVLPQGSYPRITTTSLTEVAVRPVRASTDTSRKLGIEWLDRDSDGLADYLLQLVSEGGCAAMICNTVGRAQDVYAAVRDSCSRLPVSNRPDLDLFHARFLFRDRQAREARCLERYGKPDRDDRTTAARPKRSILVATQVIEQSLDLDFDFMVSEIAPADLLLQRSGRLHRHRRADRCGNSPVLRVLGDSKRPVFAASATAVYDEHILLRTWYALGAQTGIAIPHDVENIIDRLYAEDGEPPAGAPKALRERWRSSFAAMQAKREHENDEARQRRVPSPLSGARLEDHTRDPRDEDAPELHPALQALTRLAEPSVQVALLPVGSDLHSLADCTPDLNAAREVLLNSVTITTRGVVNALVRQPVPTAWRRSGLLGRVRALSLDSNNGVMVGTTRLEYSDELGLKVVR